MAAGSPGSAGPSATPEEELSQLEQEVAAQAADKAAKQLPAPEVHDTRTEGEPGGGAGGPTAEEQLEEEAARVEAELKARLQGLTREDVQDVLELVFSLIALRRGPYWELSKEEAERISLWTHKAVLRHGVEWIGRWLPDIMAAGLLVWAIRKRVELDKRVAAGEDVKPKPKEAPNATD